MGSLIPLFPCSQLLELQLLVHGLLSLSAAILLLVRSLHMLGVLKGKGLVWMQYLLL
jgi:hypothetical protein